MAINILRRVIALTEKTQGFTVDGKPLLALITVEKAGKEYLVSLSSSNLSKADGGEYFISLAGEKEETLRLGESAGKSMRAGEGLQAERGVCALLWLENEGSVIPLAFGTSGSVAGGYGRLNAEAQKVARSPVILAPYEDDAIATENYFEKENVREKHQTERGQNAAFKEQNYKENQAQRNGVYPAENEDAPSFRGENEGSAVRDFTGDETFTRPFPFPKGETFFERKKEALIRALTLGAEELPLCRAVPGGYFVKMQAEGGKPYILGVVTFRERLEKEDIPSLSLEETLTLCYAFYAEGSPPESVKDSCHFLPVPTERGGKGYFVLCQNPVTGNAEKTDLC